MENNKKQREEAIADNINEPLQDGEVGFLFLGEQHDLRSLLSPDIQIELLDERLAEAINELHKEIDNMGGTKPERNEPYGGNGPEGRI